MNAPIRVLQVVSALGMGGAETWLLELLRHWKRQSEQRVIVDFLVTRGEVSVFDEEARSLGATIHYLNLNRSSLIQSTNKLRSITRDYRYDAIHDHQEFLSGWHFAMMGSARIPVKIAHFHNPSNQLYENYGVSFIRRAILKIGRRALGKLATDILGTSNALLNEHGIDNKSFSKHNPRSLHCAFDIGRWQGCQNKERSKLLAELEWDEDSKVVAFIGRLDPFREFNHPRRHKNSSFALSVFSEAFKRDPSLRMIFAGAPQGFENEFQLMIKEKGLEGVVRFLGVRRDIEHLMLGSDVLLFPSRAEGLGMVAVEAQASGLPVLASDAVPAECVVLPGMVEFFSLEKNSGEWARALLRIVKYPRPNPTGDRAEWKQSPYNIEVCAYYLEALYGGEDDPQLVRHES